MKKCIALEVNREIIGKIFLDVIPNKTDILLYNGEEYLVVTRTINPSNDSITLQLIKQ